MEKCAHTDRESKRERERSVVQCKSDDSLSEKRFKGFPMEEEEEGRSNRQDTQTDQHAPL